ncbi:hypothetical protein [Streptomyces sp. SYSU K217416]
MSLVELIARADERGLAASGLACLDRCLPLFVEEAGVLRPLWAGVAVGEEDWAERLTAARDALEGSAATGESAALVRQMLGAAPSEWAEAPLREWADACSVVALEIHHRLDAGDPGDEDADAERLTSCREGDTDGAGPLVAGELRRQTEILEILADPSAGGAGLRRALDLSTEGQRVLRAVVSRRARAQG